MIKTDRVIYRTRTQEEYDWLMEKLKEAGCKWQGKINPIEEAIFYTFKSDTCIFVKNKELGYGDSRNYYKEFYEGREIIEVSDLMETEKEPNSQDKTEEETDTLDELEAIHKQLTNQINDLRKQGKEPKAIEYTIKVCFE